MKRIKYTVIATLLLLGIGGAAAQSLGDYARAVRKKKAADTAPASRHFDNDNLPTNEALSVVGPPPTTGNASSAPAAPTPAPNTADRQKAADEWNNKIAKQQEKINSLSHDLDLDQRELRLRAAAKFNDPGVAVRTPQWDKDETQFRSDMEAKQKEIDAAKQELSDLQEQAKKAGVTPESKENDKDNSKDK
ncbi:MAG: hypothetical protein WCF68_08260 [Terriglobales bacterium]